LKNFSAAAKLEYDLTPAVRQRFASITVRKREIVIYMFSSVKFKLWTPLNAPFSWYRQAKHIHFAVR